MLSLLVRCATNDEERVAPVFVEKKEFISRKNNLIPVVAASWMLGYGAFCVGS